MSVTVLLISSLIGSSLSCIPTRSPDDLEEITTTTEPTTTTTTETTTTTSVATTTTTTPDNSMCQLCPNLPSCELTAAGDRPPGASCFEIMAAPMRGMAGCSITYMCPFGSMAWYKLVSNGVWVAGGNTMIMATCGDFPNNQWRSPAGDAVSKLGCSL